LARSRTRQADLDHGIFAVLTGDVIESTELSTKELERAREVLSKATKRLSAMHTQAVRGEPEFFRGDSWQVLLAEPKWALRASLLIRALLRAELGADTRISIGIGVVDKIEYQVSMSTGEAFTLSGRALDKITGYFELTGALPDRAGALAPWFSVILHLCSGLIRSWTRRQAEIVAKALMLKDPTQDKGDPTHEEIAKSLRPPVSKQTVTESLTGANWRVLLEPLRAFENTNWTELITTNRLADRGINLS